MKFLSGLSKKQILLLSSLLFLLVAIPLTMYLVKKTQIFQPKALGEASTITLLDGDGNQVPVVAGTYQPTGSIVKFRLNYNSGGTTTAAPTNRPSTSTPQRGDCTNTPNCTQSPNCVLSGGSCGSGFKDCTFTGPAPCNPVHTQQPCTVTCAVAPTPTPGSGGGGTSCKASGAACAPGGDSECCSRSCVGTSTGANAGWHCY